jgi:hypothetical protein
MKLLMLSTLVAFSLACGGGGSSATSGSSETTPTTSTTTTPTTSTWEAIAFPNTELITTRVIKDSSNSNIYFSHNGFTTSSYKTTDLSAFTQVNLPSLSQSIIYADSRLHAFKGYSDNDGATWTNFKDDGNSDLTMKSIVGSSNQLSGISFVSSAMFYSSNSGNTWSSANMNPSGSFIISVFNDPGIKTETNVVMVPHTTTGIYVSQDMGKNFNLVASSLLDIDVVAASGNSNSFFAGSKTAFVRSEDHGATWIALTVPTVANISTWYAMTVIDDQNIVGLIGGSTNGILDTSLQAVISSDGGTTWSNLGNSFTFNTGTGVPADILVTSTHYIINGTDAKFYKYAR